MTLGFVYELELTDKQPAHAAMSNAQLGRLVEALRQTAVQTPKAADLYSDWRVKGEQIPRWSKQCIGRELTPQQFAANAATAGGIVRCVVKDQVSQEEKVAGEDEALLVRRVAAWWLTGQGDRYNDPGTATYTQKVWSVYQRPGQMSQASNQQPSGSSPGKEPAKTTAPTTPQTGSQPAPAASNDKVVKVGVGRNTPYDRYMKAGYEASDKRDYRMAILFFRRALDERPQDLYAMKAIENTESYLNREKK
ncbi:MAG: hypothetical protein VKJ24_19895 [Synechococcales bacterium]|nr:hypothetical protein [Synechococcales bacterium]